MATRRSVALFAAMVFGVGLVGTSGAEQTPTHNQIVASIACAQKTKDNFGGKGPHVWHDGTYHVQYSMFHDSDEDMSEWNTFYVLFHEPDRKTGWVYKIYVHRTKGTVQIGKRGSVKKRHGGEIDIDDLWSGSGTVVINKVWLSFEFEPAVEVRSREIGQADSQCYDGKNPAPN